MPDASAPRSGRGAWTRSSLHHSESVPAQWYTGLLARAIRDVDQRDGGQRGVVWFVRGHVGALPAVQCPEGTPNPYSKEPNGSKPITSTFTDLSATACRRDGGRGVQFRLLPCRHYQVTYADRGCRAQHTCSQSSLFQTIRHRFGTST